MKALLNKYILLASTVFLLLSCKKNDPITELGDTNGEYYPMLTVSYSTSKPNLGDTVLVTASTWQRDDKIAKVELTETAIETFGLKITLNKGTNIETYNADSKLSTLVLTDTVINKRSFFEVVNSNNQLNQYFVTVTNNYVIRVPFAFEIKEGKYIDDVNIIKALTTDEFSILKSILAYNINQADYKVIFPNASADHFSSGTYALSSLGMTNLRENLTKEMLIQDMNSSKKVGSYTATVYTNVITPSGAVRSANNSFQAIL